MSREPSTEEKAIIIMTDQALEIAIDECSFRWLFCWTDNLPPEWETCFDCACCLTWDEDLKHKCGCICHKRIKELKSLFRAALRSKEKHSKSWFWDRGIDGKQKKEP